MCCALPVVDSYGSPVASHGLVEVFACCVFMTTQRVSIEERRFKL